MIDTNIVKYFHSDNITKSRRLMQNFIWDIQQMLEKGSFQVLKLLSLLFSDLLIFSYSTMIK